MTPQAIGGLQSLVTTTLQQFVSAAGYDAQSPIVVNGSIVGMNTRFGPVQFPNWNPLQAVNKTQPAAANSAGPSCSHGRALTKVRALLFKRLYSRALIKPGLRQETARPENQQRQPDPSAAEDQAVGGWQVPEWKAGEVKARKLDYPVRIQDQENWKAENPNPEYDRAHDHLPVGIGIGMKIGKGTSRLSPARHIAMHSYCL
ncbi:MAG: hypothetical protein JO110_13980 [Acetobacteraceae bacterium]|nr:hypothetical protein [Acetobacteraceae bacterium]